MSEESLLKRLFKKSTIYPLALIGLSFLWYQVSIKPNQQEAKNVQYAHEGHFKYKESLGIFEYFTSEYRHTIKGSTMGNIAYVVHYYDDEERNFKPQIDSLLGKFNQTFSTYIPDSKISSFNSKTNIGTNEWIQDLHKRALTIHETSNGVFDPTVKPLISYWGFGSSPLERNYDSTAIDSIKKLVDYSQIIISDGLMIKKNKLMQLDYGAVAKGYAVDLVGDLLKDHGVTSYIVIIGGEITTGDKKPNENSWNIAIENPTIKNPTALVRASIHNLSTATSGNYRNYKIDSITGEKYQHTIDPISGYPVKNTLLSVTVLHKNCLEADAYATALMVMGTKNAIDFAKRNDLEICLIYNEGNGEMKEYYSEGFKKLMKK